jgi:hypothetical protein
MVFDSAGDFATQNHVQIFADGWKKQTVCYVLSMRVGCGRSIRFLVIPVSDSFEHTWKGLTICNGGALKGPIGTSGLLLLNPAKYGGVISEISITTA